MRATKFDVTKTWIQFAPRGRYHRLVVEDGQETLYTVCNWSPSKGWRREWSGRLPPSLKQCSECASVECVHNIRKKRSWYEEVL